MFSDLIVQSGFAFRKRNNLMLLFEIDEFLAGLIPLLAGALGFGLEELRRARWPLQAPMLSKICGGKPLKVVVCFCRRIRHNTDGNEVGLANDFGCEAVLECGDSLLVTL